MKLPFLFTAKMVMLKPRSVTQCLARVQCNGGDSALVPQHSLAGAGVSNPLSQGKLDKLQVPHPHKGLY